MTETLDYAHPQSRRQSKAVRRLAFASLFLPLLVVGLLYGEWLLASWSLGHAPRPSLDDPKDIVGSNWMHPITGLAIIGAMPAALAAFALNIAQIVVNRPTATRAAVGISVVVLCWLALFVLLRWDPGAVVYWWFD